MKKLLTALFNAINALVKILGPRLEQHERNKAINEVNDAREAVAAGDEENLNRILEETRQKRLIGKKAGCVCILLTIVLLLIAFLLVGCITKTVVVPADRYVTRMEMDNISGWFVPDATMADLMENYVKASKFSAEPEYEDRPAHIVRVRSNPVSASSVTQNTKGQYNEETVEQDSVVLPAARKRWQGSVRYYMGSCEERSP